MPPIKRAHPKPAKAAPKLVGGKKGGAHQPKFLCPDHRVPFMLEPAINMWVCNVEGCQRSRTIETGGGPSHITRLKSEPRLIAQYDVDNDLNWSLYFKDEGILIQLPWKMTLNQNSAETETSVSGVETLGVRIKAEDFLILDAEGNPKP